VSNSQFDIRAPIRAGNAVSDEDAERIFDRVVNCTLPRPEWTHPAHLVFATVLLQREGLAGAEQSMPGMIRAYNESVGTPNNDREGYHHTITLFFLRRIYAFFSSAKGENPGAAATRLLASPLSAPDYPLNYYSKDLLYSVEARSSWKAPELRPLE